MSLLEKIDALRESALEWKLKKDSILEQLHKAEIQLDPSKINPLILSMEESYDKLREVEKQIEVLLREYIWLPECPFKLCTGRLEKTPTVGVFICTKCKANLLKGRV